MDHEQARPEETVQAYAIGGWNDGATFDIPAVDGRTVCARIDCPGRVSYLIQREVLFGHLVHLAVPALHTEDGIIDRLFPELLATVIHAGKRVPR